MDIVKVYSLVITVLLLILVFIVLFTKIFQCLQSLQIGSNFYTLRRFRDLAHLYLLRCHRFIGPLIYLDGVLQLLYIIGNMFCIFFHTTSIKNAGAWAGTLLLVNMSPLFMAIYISFLADILGISLYTVRFLHRCAGLMSSVLVLFHALTQLAGGFSLQDSRNLSAVLVCSY